MKRRDFLNHALSGTAGMALMPSMLTACGAEHDPLHDFGLITNVVKNLMDKDHRLTMSMLAEMGYKYLEFGSTYGEDPATLKQFMKSIGLVPLAGGTGLLNLQGDDLQQSIDGCLEMEKKYLICYWPWMDGGEEPTWDKVKFAVDEFHRIGEKCNEAGVRFAFHNHDHEFGKLGDQVIYDYILENTEDALVTMELDLFWAHKGGGDVREYFKKYPGRFEILHVKDSYDVPDRLSFACVGAGIINFEEIFSYRDLGGFKHLVVEHDNPGAAFEEDCARSSITHLKSLKF
jgi:sugar phosphate isomerase/epimerase